MSGARLTPPSSCSSSPPAPPLPAAQELRRRPGGAAVPVGRGDVRVCRSERTQRRVGLQHVVAAAHQAASINLLDRGPVLSTSEIGET